MKKILWVSNESGWAYDVNAKMLSSQMPQYEHHFMYTISADRDTADRVTPEMDVIVAMNPLGFYMYSDFSKVVSILDSMRALVDTDKEKFRQVPAIICCNKMLFDRMQEYSTKAILQSNGVDLNYYKPDYSQQNDKFTFGFAADIRGAYAIYKGWNVYQAAISDVPGVAQLNAIYGVNQISPDRMVQDFYNKIHCLVLLSDGEGCSNVVTEALACGVPVIITKVGYHGHALENRKQCLFVEKNIEETKRAMMLISRDAELYVQMKIAARDFAVQNHDIIKVAKRYAEIFETVKP